MTIGASAASTYKRNEIIASALRKVTKAKEGDFTQHQVDVAIKTLNGIIRSESARGKGPVHHFWALVEDYIILSAGVITYSPQANTQNILSMAYRNTLGEDDPVHLINNVSYAEIRDKASTGDPTRAYFKQTIDLADQTLFVHPVPATTAAGSEVLGSDGLNYTCVMGHTSAANNKPVTGAGYAQYWKQTGTAGATWLTATVYTNAPLLIYTYQRPLFDFDLPTDNPDMPSGWEFYLIYKLAYVLADEYPTTIEDRLFFEKRIGQELAVLHPEARVEITDVHNKGLFF